MTGTSFRFRLERVRAVRERKERIAKQELALAISRRASSEAELLDAQRHLDTAHSEQRAAAAGSPTVSAEQLRARQAFLERVEAERRRRVAELEQRQQDVEHRDAELTTAASEHEMLKRLRARHRGEHERDAPRRERNLLDEITAARFGRSPA